MAQPLGRADRAVTVTLASTSTRPPSQTVGVLHPGAMGATVASAARSSGATVLWSSDGRSSATAGRAADAGLLDVGTLSELCARSDTVISVCPPDLAGNVAAAVATRSFDGVFVDANAVSPATVSALATALAAGGAHVVDGAIIGPPAVAAGTTRLYLSGRRADDVVTLFAGSPLEAVVIGEEVGTASALKMCYAAFTKGSAALLLAVAGLARFTGVEVALRDEWDRSQPGLGERLDATARGSAPKAWRWIGEMDEIVSTFASAGLPDGFHRGAGEVFERLAGFKDADTDLDAVIRALAAEPPPT